MADAVAYKQRNRNDRRAVLESDFSKGMMSSNSIVDEGYVRSLVNLTFDKETGSIVPRPALRPYEIIMPDMTADPIDSDNAFYSSSVAIKDVKECVENGKTYYQIILGCPKEDSDGLGYLAIATVEKTDAISSVVIDDDYKYDVRYGSSYYTFVNEDVIFYSAHIPQIHDIYLVEDYSKRTEFPVGSFAYGNSYYFFISYEDDLTGDIVTSLCKTFFDTTVSPARYNYEQVTPKTLSVSEAVSYGYNMLLKDAAYDFINQHSAPTMQFEGLLPYDVTGIELLMTPKRNQPVLFKAFYNVVNDRKFDIVWEWRETTSADWTVIQTDKAVVFSSSTTLSVYFQPPATDMMMRISAYPYVDNNGDVDDTSNTVSDTVEKAMVVGFDFSVENYGAASAVEQKIYDLSTATGMESWNGRIVLWGVPEDPTILFISDYNEPSYFPYPNNIVVFDEPVIYAVEFMDSLCVFTTNKLYQVSLVEDGNSWNSTVLQSHLSINPWDKHLIQTVRNMLYFKSGNYYYMMVPKAQSQTGELTLAPITNPITSFFDNFSVNVQNILQETYGYTGICELISYYNFLDYEDIHNLYLYRFDNTGAIMHFDVIYNTVDRTWKVWVYEAAHILFPFKHNATEPGLLAVTSLINAYDINDPSEYNYKRIIQLFTWDKLSVRGSYIPNGTVLNYDSAQDSAQTEGQVVVVPSALATIDENGVVVFGESYADQYGSLVVILGATGYYSGFSTDEISKVLINIYESGEEYFTFRNFQFIDTGYRDDELQNKKRYREVQILVDNLDKKNLQFGMEYLLDGAPTKIYYKYDTTQIIDEFDPEYGVIYVDSTPYLEVELNNIDNLNQWIIDQDLNPDIAFWKIRIAVAGKGASPRLKLYSKNEKRFGILSVNWVSRIMHMR